MLLRSKALACRAKKEWPMISAMWKRFAAKFVALTNRVRSEKGDPEEIASQVRRRRSDAPHQTPEDKSTVPTYFGVLGSASTFSSLKESLSTKKQSKK
jgi:hypothetical protein